MTRTLLEIATLVALGLAAVWAYGEVQADRAEDAAERERLRERVVEAEAARASVDSAARLRVASLRSDIDSLEREGARLDTVVEVRTVALREMVPDSVQPAVDSLVAACDRRVETCRAAKDSLRSVVLTRERQLAATDSLLAAREALIGKLEDDLDPPFWEDVFGDLPGTLGKVGAGVLIGVVVAQ